MEYHYYHGTSWESAISILKNGFSSERSVIWNCVDEDLIYLASSQDNDKTGYNDDCFYISEEASQIAAAFRNSSFTDTVVFEFIINESDFDAFILEDDSCENMDQCYQIRCQNLNDLMKQGALCNIYICKKAYNPFLRFLYLQNLNQDYLNISPQLEDAFELTKGCDLFVEELFESYSYDVFSLDSFKLKYLLKEAS